MLTTTSTFKRYFESSLVQPVILATIETKAGASFDATDAVWANATFYPASIANISSLSTELDPVSRKSKVSEVQITFAADGWFQNILVNNKLKSAKITMRLGDTRMTSLSDFAPYFVGAIDKIRPEQDGTYDVSCLDVMSLLLDREIVGYWINKHPLGIIEDIVINKVGVPSSLVDTTSLDPTQATYTSSISHWVMSRGGHKTWYEDFSVNRPVKANKLIDELAQLMNGHLVVTEEGKLKFVQFSTSATIRDVWTHDDMVVESLEVETLDDNQITELIVNFNKIAGHAEVGSGQQVPGKGVFALKDSNAATDIGYPGTSERIINHTIDTPWIEGEGNIPSVNGVAGAVMTPTSPAVGQNFEVSGPLVHGMVGSRWPGYPVGSQPTGATLSSTRTGYIQIDSEIIEVDQITISTSGAPYYQVVLTDPATGQDVNAGSQPQRVTYRVKTRGALGTAAADHKAGLPGSTISPAVAFDVTIPATIAKQLIERFGDGAPVLKVRTPLGKYHLQLGDVINLVTDRIRYRDHANGLDTTDAWEIIGKEVQIYNGTPSIEWKLCWAFKSSPRSVTWSASPRAPAAKGMLAVGASMTSAMQNQTLLQTQLDGVSVSAASGLTASIAAGVIKTGVSVTSINSALTVPVEASKDNYLSVDPATKAVFVQPVAVAAAAPTLLPGTTLLAKVTTGVSSVSAVTDLRNTLETIVATKVTTTAIKPAAVTTQALNTSFENFSNLLPNSNFSMLSRG